MYSLFIDDSGSLHPKHQNEFLVMAGFLIPTRDLKRFKNIVKKVLAITGKSEFKSPEIDIYFPTLLNKLEKIWPRPTSDCFFIYLNKTGVYKNPEEFSLKKENEIRAKAIGLVAKKFLDKSNNYLDVIFDEFYSNKDSETIKSILNTKYKFRKYINYNYNSSNKTPGLKVAHCFANLFLRFKEKDKRLLPYLNNSFKEYNLQTERYMKELKIFTHSL